MDDTDILRCATDCALPDSDASYGQNDTPAGAPSQTELTPALPPEIKDQAIVDDRARTGGDDERAGGNGPALLRDASRADATPSNEQIIEALLFSSDTPLSAARLAEVVGCCTPAAARKHIDGLNEKYAQAGLSFRIEAIARGYQMMTLPDVRAWVAKLHKQRSETRLSAAALETLSIIAYKQPVIRADVEAIRGVACSEVVARLRDMGLVRVLGRAEVVGRPLLYGTTKKFLDVFGLTDLDDLPPMEALELRRGSKPVAEVEPVPPPLESEPMLEPVAAVGA